MIESTTSEVVPAWTGVDEENDDGDSNKASKRNSENTNGQSGAKYKPKKPQVNAWTTISDQEAGQAGTQTKTGPPSLNLKDANVPRHGGPVSPRRTAMKNPMVSAMMQISHEGSAAKKYKKKKKKSSKEGSTDSQDHDNESSSSDDEDEDAGSSRCLPDVIAPTSAFRTRWDVIFLALLLFNLMEIPFRAAFEIELDLSHPLEVVNLIVDCFFLCDIFLNFRTGFFKEGIFITDRKVIAKRYVSTWFGLDLLTSIPFKHIVFIFANSTGGAAWLKFPKALRFFRYARVLKMFRILKMFKVISRWEDEAQYLSSILGIGKLIFVIYFICHLSACALLQVAQMEADDNGVFNSSSWVVQRGFKRSTDIEIGELYLSGIYWSITTIATVGYGDITPGTVAEQGVTIVIVFVGSCAFGYIIGNVASYVSHTDESTRHLRKKIKAIKEYIRYRKLPPSLSRRIRSHYEYAWTRSTVYNEEKILKDLPSFLRTEVITYLYADLIEGVPLLQEMGKDCATLLVTKLKPMYLAPGQVIFKEGSVGGEMYLIHEGVLDVIVGGEIIMKLSTGEYVGEYSLLTEKPEKRTFTAMADTYVHLLELSKQEYDKMLELYPEVYTRMAKRAEDKMEMLEQKTRTTVAADSGKAKFHRGLKRLKTSISLRAQHLKVGGATSDSSDASETQSNQLRPSGARRRSRRKSSVISLLGGKKTTPRKRGSTSSGDGGDGAMVEAASPAPASPHASPGSASPHSSPYASPGPATADHFSQEMNSGISSGFMNRAVKKMDSIKNLGSSFRASAKTLQMSSVDHEMLSNLESRQKNVENLLAGIAAALQGQQQSLPGSTNVTHGDKNEYIAEESEL